MLEGCREVLAHLLVTNRADGPRHAKCKDAINELTALTDWRQPFDDFLGLLLRDRLNVVRFDEGVHVSRDDLHHVVYNRVRLLEDDGAVIIRDMLIHRLIDPVEEHQQPLQARDALRRVNLGHEGALCTLPAHRQAVEAANRRNVVHLVLDHRPAGLQVRLQLQ